MTEQEKDLTTTEQQHHHHAIVIGMGEDGEPHLIAEAPPGLRELLAEALGSDEHSEKLHEFLGEALDRLKMSMMKAEIKRWVTPQVANEVLSSYGDPDASVPSLATQSLITLIRTCYISDDAMMEELNQCEAFHGYVLAVAMLAGTEDEPVHQAAMERLRILAGLDQEPADA